LSQGIGGPAGGGQWVASGQLKVEDKSDEITAVPKLLRVLEMVSGDQQKKNADSKAARKPPAGIIAMYSTCSALI
jgi:hypothetical protein